MRHHEGVRHWCIAIRTVLAVEHVEHNQCVEKVLRTARMEVEFFLQRFERFGPSASTSNKPSVTAVRSAFDAKKPNPSSMRGQSFRSFPGIYIPIIVMCYHTSHIESAPCIQHGCRDLPSTEDSNEAKNFHLVVRSRSTDDDSLAYVVGGERPLVAAVSRDFVLREPTLRGDLPADRPVEIDSLDFAPLE